MDTIPFRPADPDATGFPMPPTVPPGMRLELSRSKILPGEEATAREWMRTLTERHGECEATLSAERAAFEATFLHVEADGSTWIYHLTLAGEDGCGLDPDARDIDRTHIDYAMRAKMPGWEELEPMLMLTPDHIRASMKRWGQTGSAG